MISLRTTGHRSLNLPFLLTALGLLCFLPSLNSMAQAPDNLTKYYVDNINGSDDQYPDQDPLAGRSEARAFKSIDKINHTNFPQASAVLFYPSQIFQGMLAGKINLEYIGGYPSTDSGSCSWNSGSPTCVSRPVIDPTASLPLVIPGSNPAQRYTWEPVAGSSSTFKTPFTPTAYKVFVDGAYQQTIPLQTSSDGSWGRVLQEPGTMTSYQGFVYVHLLDNTSPAFHDIRVASDDMMYGIITGAAGHVTIEGMVVQHAPMDGIAILNPDYTPGQTTGGKVTIVGSAIYNSGSTVLRNGVLEPLTDPKTLAKTDANIAVIPDAAGQGMIHDILIMQTLIGRLDVPANTNNYDGAGISLKNTYGAYLQNTKIATVNGWGLSVDDYHSPSGDCQRLTIQTIEVTASEGNIRIAGCSAVSVTDAYVHDSYGNAFQLQPGQCHQPLSPSKECPEHDQRFDDHITLQDLHIDTLHSAYGGQLYNGIDTNWAKHLTVTGANIYRVAESSITLEDDELGEDVASTGFTLKDSTLDASENVKANGEMCSTVGSCFPLYVRDNALALNDWSVINLVLHPVQFPASAALDTLKVARWDASSASDANHDLTQDQLTHVLMNH